MRTILALLLGLALAGNGVFMLADPARWYALVGAAGTGPLNAHFVRDVGSAYLVTGVAVAWFAFDARLRLAAAAGAGFLALHALVHIGEAIAGQRDAGQLAGDLVPVFAPAAILLWLVWSSPRSR